MSCIFYYFIIPKVLFNFERQPSQLQIAPRRGEQESEGCCHLLQVSDMIIKSNPATRELPWVGLRFTYGSLGQNYKKTAGQYGRP